MVKHQLPFEPVSFSIKTEDNLQIKKSRHQFTVLLGWLACFFALILILVFEGMYHLTLVLMGFSVGLAMMDLSKGKR